MWRSWSRLSDSPETLLEPITNDCSCVMPHECSWALPFSRLNMFGGAGASLAGTVRDVLHRFQRLVSAHKRSGFFGAAVQTMDFTFTHNSPYNTQIIGAGVAYDVQSRGLISRKTAIYRDGSVVANIEWHSWSASIMSMGGQQHTVDDFLRPVGSFGT